MSERRKLTYSERKSISTRKSNLPMATNRSSFISRPSNISRPSTVSRPSTGLRSIAPSSATRSLSAKRSSSATRLTQDKNVRSSGGLRRYGSDNYLNTPSRFTLSTPLHGRSPAVRHSVMPPDSSRKSKQGNLMKLQEILQRDEAFYADLNLKNGCLKSMTINQFYLIIERFVVLICGKKLNTFGTDPITCILNFMQQLECPYTVNKSMLKTPNAPHTFDQVVIVLLWLGNISSVSSIAKDDELMERFLFTKDEQFPNEEYTANFSKSIQEGYRLWNSESDDHTAFIDRLTDKLIAAKLENKVSSVAELQALTEKLDAKSKELIDNPVQLNNVHQFEELESKYIEYETKEHDLMNQLKEKRDRLAAIQINWNEKCGKVEKSKGKIQELSNQIQKQKYNINDYKKLAEKISQLKSAIGTMQNEIRMVRDEESNQHINQARLLKKVSEAINKINDRGMQIVKLLNNSRLPISERDLNRLHLSATPTVQQVKEIAQMLSHIFSVVKLQKHKLQIELDRANSQLNILKAESHMLTKEYQSAQKNYEKITFEREVLEKKSTMENKKSENCVHKLAKQVEDGKAKLQMLKDEIAACCAKEKELKKKNMELMDDGEAQAMKIIEEKQRMLKQLNELDKLLDEKLDGTDYPK